MKKSIEVSSIFPEEHGLGGFNIKHCDEAVSMPGHRWNKMDEFGHNDPSDAEMISLVEHEINSGTLFGGEGFFHEDSA